MIMVSSIVSSRFGEGFRRPSDREDIVYLDRGQLGLAISFQLSAILVLLFFVVLGGGLLIVAVSSARTAPSPDHGGGGG